MKEIIYRMEHLLAELQDLRIEAEGYLEEPHQCNADCCPIELLVGDINGQILTYCRFLSWLRQITESA